jgi:hypothetical protein
MESSYQALLNIYSETIDSLKEAASSLETLKYELLIDPESAYQKALVEVNNAKAELNALKQEIANEENPSILLEAELKIKEGLLEGVTLVLDNAEKVTSSTIDLTKEALEKIVVSLEEQEENFPTEIKTELTNKVKDLEIILCLNNEIYIFADKQK